MAQQTKTKVRKKKRRVSRFTTMLIMLGVIAVLVVATLFMRSAYQSALNGPGDRPEEQKGSLFSVKAVTVSGNTRYLTEAIVQQSGLFVGQSVWSVDKAEAEEKILAAFPYIEEVDVTNTAYNKLNIAVTETREIGVMYGHGKWLAVGANGRVLDARSVESDRPLRGLYFKGATPLSATPGEQAMDDRSFAIVTELLAAFEQYKLEGVHEIDLANKSDLRLRWNNRLVIKLGNDSNLTHEIGVVVSALPSIEAQYGANAAGQLDVSAFSEEGGIGRAVFTPQDLLPSSTTTTVDPENTTSEGETAGTTAGE